MDFHATYYPPAQPYQFIGIPPLTPNTSDEYTNSTSPPDGFEQRFPNGLPDQYQTFDGFVGFNPQQTFPAPPTPPGQHPAAVQPVNPAAHSSGPGPAADLLPITKAESDEQSRRQGSNSDEDELTPAQSRRKAQNRAAQRAFRERKERHVKDLETRLQQLEQREQQTATENERLRRDLQRVSTENEILRATSLVGGSAGSPASNATPTTTGPMSYNPKDFYSNVLQNHANKTPSHRIVTSDDGERLLAAGATWDLIINHELFKRGRVDIGDVSERLKPLAKCDGQGPVFEESAIIEAIEKSVASGSDELL